MTEMHKDFDGPPKTREEGGLRIDYLRSQGVQGSRGRPNLGETAKLVGTSTNEVIASKRFYDSDRQGG